MLDQKEEQIVKEGLSSLDELEALKAKEKEQTAKESEERERALNFESSVSALDEVETLFSSHDLDSTSYSDLPNSF